MSLDVETPDPPTLSGPQDLGDYDAVDEQDEETGDTHRRDDLAEFLRDGAWADAFGEWAEFTDLDDDAFRAALELGLFEEFDFYWNPSAEDVGYRAPAVPDDPPPEYDEALGNADLDDELDALGRTVSEVLENDYIHRDGDEFGYDWE